MEKNTQSICTCLFVGVMFMSIRFFVSQKTNCLTQKSCYPRSCEWNDSYMYVPRPRRQLNRKYPNTYFFEPKASMRKLIRTIKIQRRKFQELRYMEKLIMIQPIRMCLSWSLKHSHTIDCTVHVYMQRMYSTHYL